MHKKTKELARHTTCTSGGCIKGKDGTVLMEKAQILQRWTEYIQELFEDDRGDLPQIRRDIDGPNILKDEGKFAIKYMKRNKHNKACGPDNINTDILHATKKINNKKKTEIA